MISTFVALAFCAVGAAFMASLQGLHNSFTHRNELVSNYVFITIGISLVLAVLFLAINIGTGL